MEIIAHVLAGALAQGLDGDRPVIRSGDGASTSDDDSLVLGPSEDAEVLLFELA